jgi:hypothetical protein
MTPNDMRLVADAYVLTALGSGHTIEQLIEYVEQTKRSPALVQAIRKAARQEGRPQRF